MKVYELIEFLETVDENAEVMVEDEDGAIYETTDFVDQDGGQVVVIGVELH